jgi:hypothetical protein
MNGPSDNSANVTVNAIQNADGRQPVRTAATIATIAVKVSDATFSR